MTNVIQFPNDRKIDTITTEIADLQEQIAERFEVLTTLFVQSRDLEKECTILQERYDARVLEYAAAVGPENIPAGILEYCTQVIAMCDGDGSEIRLAFDTAVDGGIPLVDESTDEAVPALKGTQLEDITEFMNEISKYIKGKMDELQ